MIKIIRIPRVAFLPILIALIAANLSLLHAADAPAPAANAPAAVQFDISKILNARTVITFSDGKVVAVHGGVGSDALITTAAAAALGVKDLHALPDDGKFPANADRPEVILHFSNSDGTSNQVHRSDKSSKDDEYSFDVPAREYDKLFLFFTSASFGPAQLTIGLTYKDGSTESRSGMIPDWAKNLDPTDKDRVYLVSDLSKWSSGDKIKLLEKNNHNIVGLVVRPTPGKVLTQVKVHKTGPYVDFWGAIGQRAK